MNKWRSMLRLANYIGIRRFLELGRMKRINRETIRGYYATRAITALIDVGLFHALAQQKSVDLVAFAASKNLNHQILETVCAYLYELKILNRQGGEYCLDVDGQLIADTMGGAYDLVQAYGPLISNLEALLRQEKIYNIDIHRDPALVAKGSSAVGRFLAFPVMAMQLKQLGLKRILDLGCGDGTFLTDLCLRNPEVIAFGVDITPEAILMGQMRIEENGLSDRVHLLVGDICEIKSLAGQLNHNVDVATFVYVLHEFQDDIIFMLRHFRAAIPDVPLLICEVIRHTPDQLRAKPGGVSEIQFFHELSNQRLFTLAEWREIFSRAGFCTVEEHYLEFARTCIFYVS